MPRTSSFPSVTGLPFSCQAQECEWGAGDRGGEESGRDGAETPQLDPPITICSGGKGATPAFLPPPLRAPQEHLLGPKAQLQVCDFSPLPAPNPHPAMGPVASISVFYNRPAAPSPGLTYVLLRTSCSESAALPQLLGTERVLWREAPSWEGPLHNLAAYSELTATWLNTLVHRVLHFLQVSSPCSVLHASSPAGHGDNTLRLTATAPT